MQLQYMHVMQVGKKGGEKSGGMLKIGHLWLKIQLYLTEYNAC